MAKKKFDIRYTLKGPARTMEVENTPNPVECEDLDGVIRNLAEAGLPKLFGGAKLIALRIAEVEDEHQQ